MLNQTKKGMQLFENKKTRKQFAGHFVFKTNAAFENSLNKCLLINVALLLHFRPNVGLAVDLAVDLAADLAVGPAVNLTVGPTVSPNPNNDSRSKGRSEYHSVSSVSDSVPNSANLLFAL